MDRRRRRLVVLGSTGSIGRQTLEVVRHLADRFEVIGLAAGHASEILEAQVAEFRPRLVAVGKAEPGDASLPEGALLGQEGLIRLATMPEADLVMMATVGTSGVQATLAAVAAGKTIALANKEALVMAGHLVTGGARRSGAQILPVDSEHSAIWQCLRGEGELGDWLSSVKTLILTASGGALRDLPLDELENVSPEKVLHHPTWSMGPKVTVDSATLMNKGLEVIEARWLFGIPLDRIKVLLHRESIVHSLVEFVDGSVKAQLSAPDMRIPIQYALCYPERLAGPVPRLDLAHAGCLSFGEIDVARYPCLRLAVDAAKADRSYPAALSAANEVAVDLFLRREIAFGTIPRIVEETLSRHRPVDIDTPDGVLAVDEEARDQAMATAGAMRGN